MAINEIYHHFFRELNKDKYELSIDLNGYFISKSYVSMSYFAKHVYMYIKYTHT